MTAKAYVVVDLGFGDAGKGTITDFLVRSRGASLVVRFNGGAQAGHNVVTDDGRHHTFSQFGSGTFVPGVRTHLTEAVVVHPTALLVERAHLEHGGVHDALDRLTIAPTARVTTPYHQALGRLRELARGEGRHGTCGVGVGETVRDALSDPDDALRAHDLWAGPERLGRRLARVRERLWPAARAELKKCGDSTEGRRELALFEDPEVGARWIELIAPLVAQRGVLDDAAGARLGRGETVVLEGAQGVLLDEHWGFHPHTTWSECTPDGAVGWLRGQGFGEPVHRVGVVRTYMTRHGQGPLPSATPDLDDLGEPHNGDAGWQGRFRRGWPDPILWNYALGATGGVDSLAVTHLDRLGSAARWRVVERHRGLPADTLDDAGAIRARAPSDFDGRARLTAALGAAQAELGDLPGPAGDGLAVRFERWVSDALETPVSITSEGPTAADKATPRPELLDRGAADRGR